MGAAPTGRTAPEGLMPHGLNAQDHLTLNPKYPAVHASTSV